MKLLSEEVAEAIDVLSRVPRRIELIRKEIELCDKEEVDLKHKIELSKCNAYEGWRLYKDFQITLQKRRELKNEIQKLNDVNARLRKKGSLENSIKDISKKIQNTNRTQSAKTYRVRVRKDFVDNKEIVSRSI